MGGTLTKSRPAGKLCSSKKYQMLHLTFLC